MSASLRSAVPTGVRRRAIGSGRPAVPWRHPIAHNHHIQLDQGNPGKHAGQTALTGEAEQPSSRPPALESCFAARDRRAHQLPNGPSESTGWGALAERLSGPVLSGCRARPGCRRGWRRGVAGLVVVCVLALGVVACSVKDAKAEASASASASASTAVGRAEQGIADANASATASREAALTPELRAKRDAALAEPAPAKPEQMNEESPEGAASSVHYFLELYRYAFMTGNTTELAAMSEDQCKFCQSTIDDANDIHNKGGWADKWDQEIVSTTVYEKLEGYDYNRVKVVINYGKMTSYYGDGQNPSTSEPSEEKVVNVAARYSGNRWLIGNVEVEHK